MDKEISTKTLEKRLGKILTKNRTCIGLDLASVTGLSIIKVYNGITRIYTTKAKLGGTQSKEDLTKKLDNLIDFLQQIDRNVFGGDYTKDIIIIENSYLGINIWTYGILRLLAGITYAHYRFLGAPKENIIFLFANSARKKTGFKKSSPEIKGNKLKQEITEFVTNIVKEKITHDEADAIVLALAGLIKEFTQGKLK